MVPTQLLGSKHRLIKKSLVDIPVFQVGTNLNGDSYVVGDQYYFVDSEKPKKYKIPNKSKEKKTCFVPLVDEYIVCFESHILMVQLSKKQVITKFNLKKIGLNPAKSPYSFLKRGTTLIFSNLEHVLAVHQKTRTIKLIKKHKKKNYKHVVASNRSLWFADDYRVHLYNPTNQSEALHYKSPCKVHKLAIWEKQPVVVCANTVVFLNKDGSNAHKVALKGASSIKDALFSKNKHVYLTSENLMYVFDLESQNKEKFPLSSLAYHSLSWFGEGDIAVWLDDHIDFFEANSFVVSLK